MGVDIAWSGGRLTEAVLTPKVAQRLEVVNPGIAGLKITDSSGNEVRFSAVAHHDGSLDGDRVAFEVKAGETYTIAAGTIFSTVFWLIDQAEAEGRLTPAQVADVRKHIEQAWKLANSPASKRAVEAQLDNAVRKSGTRATELVTAIRALAAASA